MFGANNTKTNIFLFNLHFKSIKMVWKHMGHDTKFVIKLDILSHICNFKRYYSFILKLWRMGLFIRHKFGERKNFVVHRWSRYSKPCWTIKKCMDWDELILFLNNVINAFFQSGNLPKILSLNLQVKEVSLNWTKSNHQPTFRSDSTANRIRSENFTETLFPMQKFTLSVLIRDWTSRICVDPIQDRTW